MLNTERRTNTAHTQNKELDNGTTSTRNLNLEFWDRAKDKPESRLRSVTIHNSLQIKIPWRTHQCSWCYVVSLRLNVETWNMKKCQWCIAIHHSPFTTIHFHCLLRSRVLCTVICNLSNISDISQLQGATCTAQTEEERANVIHDTVRNTWYRYVVQCCSVVW